MSLSNLFKKVGMQPAGPKAVDERQNEDGIEAARLPAYDKSSIESLSRAESAYAHEAGNVLARDLYGPEGRLAMTQLQIKYADKKSMELKSAANLAGEASTLELNLSEDLLAQFKDMRGPRGVLTSSTTAEQQTAAVIGNAAKRIADAVAAVSAMIKSQTAPRLSPEKIVEGEGAPQDVSRNIQGMTSANNKRPGSGQAG